MVAPAADPPAQHAAAHEAPIEDDVSLSYGVVSYQAALYALDYGTLSAANHLWLPPGIELGAGLRLAFGDHLPGGYGMEGFGSASLVPHFATAVDSVGRTASWRPSLGFEIGATTADYVSPKVSPGSFVTQGPSPKGFYAALAARPVRFRFGAFNASVLGLVFGTVLASPGRQVRIHIDVVQIGLAL